MKRTVLAGFVLWGLFIGRTMAAETKKVEDVCPPTLVCFTVDEAARLVDRMIDMQAEIDTLKLGAPKFKWIGEFGMRTGTAPNDSGLYAGAGAQWRMFVVGVEAYGNDVVVRGGLRLTF